MKKIDERKWINLAQPINDFYMEGNYIMGDMRLLEDWKSNMWIVLSRLQVLAR
ncbi:MAG: hypothetical protein JST82_06580 [Bacteroidetes bacterium]|nr:hypothetical protein [Bacteroidota bacterium]